MTDGQPAERGPRGRARRWLIVALALFFVGVAAGVYVRGTWADPAVRNPGSSAEGAVCQLYRTAGGAKVVRCARVLDHPPREVWQAITDYEKFPQIFGARHWQMEVSKVSPMAQGRRRMTGQVRSIVGTFPVDVVIRHSRSKTGGTASWDAPSGKITANRGHWQVTPLEGGKTLLVYELEIQLEGYPRFLVNNVLLSQMPNAVQAVADWLSGQTRK